MTHQKIANYTNPYKFIADSTPLYYNMYSMIVNLTCELLYDHKISITDKNASISAFVLKYKIQSPLVSFTSRHANSFKPKL